MTRMPFLYVETQERKSKWPKLVVQFLLAVEVVTFCAFLALHTN
jgi:hypothetical protein